MFLFSLPLAGSRRTFNTCCWMGNAVGCKQSHRFLERSRNNFLAQILDRTARRGTLLLHINKEDLIKGVTVIANPDWTDHEAVLFKILRGVRKNNSTMKSLCSRRMHFGLFREMVGSAKEVRQRLRNFMPPIPWSGKIYSQASQVSAPSGRF